MRKKTARTSRSTHSNAAFRPGALPLLNATNPLFSPSAMRVTGYDGSGSETQELSRTEELGAFTSKWPNVWIEVDGIGNSTLLLDLGKYYHLHALTLEDIFDARHQPKVEEYDKYIFVMLRRGTCTESLDLEQVSLILMEHVVITICERPGEGFAEVRGHIAKGTGKVRQFGPDFLFCALIDATVEGYYPILGKIREWLDGIEDTFLEKTSVNVIKRIHDIKHDLLLLHSAVWPVQEIMINLGKQGRPLIREGTAHYLRDCQDQARQVKELAEFYRLIASDLMNTSLAFSDNKANEVMKVLTMVSALFIPLSFLTGLYGMNFDYSVSHYNMPELKSPYGYPILLAVMLTMAACTLAMFWRKGWFSGGKS